MLYKSKSAYIFRHFIIFNSMLYTVQERSLVAAVPKKLPLKVLEAEMGFCEILKNMKGFAMEVLDL